MEAKIKDNKVILRYARETIELTEEDLTIIFNPNIWSSDLLNKLEDAIPLKDRKTSYDLMRVKYKALIDKITEAKINEDTNYIDWEEDEDGEE